MFAPKLGHEKAPDLRLSVLASDASSLLWVRSDIFELVSAMSDASSLFWLSNAPLRGTLPRSIFHNGVCCLAIQLLRVLLQENVKSSCISLVQQGSLIDRPTDPPTLTCPLHEAFHDDERTADCLDFLLKV